MIVGRVRHTVALTLAHPEGSAGDRDFLEVAERLAVAGVEAFELLAEVSSKNGYRFGIDGVRRPGLRTTGTTSTRTTCASCRSAGWPR